MTAKRLKVKAWKMAVQKRIEVPRSTPETKQQDRNYLEFVNKISASGPIEYVRFTSGHYGLQRIDV